MSLGPSSHKNEYRPGVRVGNWVEELCGHEAPDCPPLTIAPEPNSPAANYRPPVSNPRPCETADLLFSHGNNFGESFQATMNGLHYRTPDDRAHDFKVHRTFFWGSKLMDGTCPNIDPNAGTSLLEKKRQQWVSERK